MSLKLAHLATSRLQSVRRWLWYSTVIRLALWWRLREMAPEAQNLFVEFTRFKRFGPNIPTDVLIQLSEASELLRAQSLSADLSETQLNQKNIREAIFHFVRARRQLRRADRLYHEIKTKLPLFPTNLG